MNELGYCLFSDKDEPFDEKSYEAKSGERTNQVNDFSRMNDIYSEIYEIIDDVFEDIDSHKKTELSESVISIFTKYKQQFAQLIPNTNYLNLYDYSNNNQNSISPSNIKLIIVSIAKLQLSDSKLRYVSPKFMVTSDSCSPSILFSSLLSNSISTIYLIFTTIQVSPASI